MSKHSIAVLQDDIDNGTIVSPYDCPIARAVKRDLQREDDDAYVSVNCTHIFLHANYFTYDRAPLPPAASSFIKRFDSGQPVEPFKFEIELED